MKIAFLFPGQGSQKAGMGYDLLAFPAAASYFERADAVLHMPISRLCFEGPEEELVRTEIQQPAIFLVSCATYAILAENGLRPGAVAGHSLGEYSALVAAGVLSFEDGIRLTRRRGELMAETAHTSGGTMAAILGLPPEQVEAVCASAAGAGVVECANFNSPTQTVISGEEAAVERAMELARQAGASKVVRLPVSAPFHCSLMEQVAERFAPVLNAASWHDPEVPVIANVTAAVENTALEVRRNLLRQLAAPVRWNASVQYLVGQGYDTFIEVGPGRVLTGLMKSIARDVTAFSTQNLAAIEKVLALG